MPINFGAIWRVFLGGALGTLLRLVVMVFTTQLGLLVVVNVLGSAFLGWANGDRRFDGNNASAFWKVGFSGGFTTMSGVALYLADIQSGLGQIVVVVLMMVVGLMAYLGSKNWASKWAR